MANDYDISKAKKAYKTIIDNILMKGGNKYIKYRTLEYPEAIFVYNLYVPPEYRKKNLPQKLFYSLVVKYNKCIMLECEEKLLNYYIKIGFRIVEGKDENGRYLMELPKE